MRRSSNSPAVGGSGDQRAHVEGDHAAFAQRLGHVAGDDPLGEALDDRGLADAGLADQHGVVLRAPGENLDHATDLLVAPDHRVELALLCHLGEVAPEALQRTLLDVLPLARGLLGRDGAWGAVRSHGGTSGGRDRTCERTSAARTMSVEPPLVGDELGAEGAAHLLQALGQLDLGVQGLHLERLDAGVHVVDLGLEVEHALDAGEVEAELGGHLLDAPQPLDVLLGVQARATGGALGGDQPARLVGAQGLGVHVCELGGDGDHEHAAVGLDLDAGYRFGSHDGAPPSAPVPLPAGSNRRARGLPFMTFAKASTADCCSSESESGMSSTKR